MLFLRNCRQHIIFSINWDPLQIAATKQRHHATKSKESSGTHDKDRPVYNALHLLPQYGHHSWSLAGSTFYTVISQASHQLKSTRKYSRTRPLNVDWPELSSFHRPTDRHTPACTPCSKKSSRLSARVTFADDETRSIKTQPLSDCHTPQTNWIDPGKYCGHLASHPSSHRIGCIKSSFNARSCFRRRIPQSRRLSSAGGFKFN